MSRDIRQTDSGVAGGEIGTPRRKGGNSEKTPAGRALASRKHAGVRARKLAARRQLRSR